MVTIFNGFLKRLNKYKIFKEKEISLIIEYVKGFLVLFLLIKVLLYFVPKNGFAKYISFFSGVILVLGILNPLLRLFGQEEKFLESFQYQDWEEAFLEISKEAEEIQEEGMEQLEKRYMEVEEVLIEEDTEED